MVEIDFEVVEQSKENVMPLKKGRKMAALSESCENANSKQFAEKNDAIKKCVAKYFLEKTTITLFFRQFEESISMDESDDPLEPWIK